MLSAARTKTIAAQDRPAGLWFEGTHIGLAALIANNLESFAFAASATSLLWSTKAGAARIATWFASLRVTQAPLAIIVLFSLTKWEGSPTLGARDVQIRH